MTQEPVGPIDVRTFDELNFTVRATPYSHYVEYQIFHVEWITDDTSRGPGLHPYWSRKNARCNGDPVNNLDEAEVIIEGSVKWDGCSNWELGKEQANTGVMYHGCSQADLYRIGDILAICWEMTDELCPHWDQGGNLMAAVSAEYALTKMMLMFPSATKEQLKPLVTLALAMDSGKLKTVEAMGAVVDLQDAVNLKTYLIDAPVPDESTTQSWDVEKDHPVRLYAVSGRPGERILITVATASKSYQPPTKH